MQQKPTTLLFNHDPKGGPTRRPRPQAWWPSGTPRRTYAPRMTEGGHWRGRARWERSPHPLPSSLPPPRRLCMDTTRHTNVHVATIVSIQQAQRHAYSVTRPKPSHSLSLQTAFHEHMRVCDVYLLGPLPPHPADIHTHHKETDPQPS